MNMREIETAKTITDIWYTKKITSNKYLHNFSLITIIIHLQSYCHYIYISKIALSGEIIST